MLRFLIVFMFSTSAFAYNEARENKAPNGGDLKAAEKFGYSRSEVLKKSRETRAKFNADAVITATESLLQNDDQLTAAADDTVERIVSQADVVLRRFGYTDDADQMTLEYRSRYRGWLNCWRARCKEIGDHPPLWQWLAEVHEKIESKIGADWCKFFHLHDMYIVNHALPVVFDPERYEKKDYVDHFAGHMKAPFWWDHHGLAGVITYWAAQVVCTGGTFSLGLVGFVCGPIASFTEHVVDKKIAPPLAVRIWKRANQ